MIYTPLQATNEQVHQSLYKTRMIGSNRIKIACAHTQSERLCKHALNSLSLQNVKIIAGSNTRI